MSYKIKETGEIINSFMKACDEAQKISGHVVEVSTGLIRWRPAAPVNAKKIRQYTERMAAFDAQKRQPSADCDLIPYCTE